MILQPFFRKHFWLTTLVFAMILSVAFSTSHFLIRVDRSDFFKTQGNLILAHLLRQSGDRIAYAKQLNETERDLGIPMQIDLVRDGKSLLSGETHNPEGLGPRTYVHDILLPEPATLIVTFSPRHEGAADRGRAGYLFTFSVMLIAILIASTVSIFLLFWSFRGKAEMAKTVLTRMQKGDLKARFPITPLDEAGRIMGLYNQMADEIERLVEQLKANESHRLHLLQELTHDLRTPVSSLRNLIETLRFSSAKLDANAKEELMELAYQETEYLTRLVEDLLFLALVLEPKYKSDTEEVAVEQIVRAQMSATASHYSAIQFETKNRLPGATGELKFAGSSHLIKRLMRNALENAFSYAKSRVEVELSKETHFLVITIRDDGPGFDPEGLKSFGKKRTTRYQGSNQDNARISVGLGSVIIQAIANAHDGSAQVENIHPGAQVTIRLNLAV